MELMNACSAMKLETGNRNCFNVNVVNVDERLKSTTFTT